MKSQFLALAALSSTLVAASTTKLCDTFANTNDGTWYFNNNKWSLSNCGSDCPSGNQCTFIQSSDNGHVEWRAEWSWSWPGHENNVKGYPYSGRVLGEKKKVSEIKSITSGAAWEYTGQDIRANVAYDLFTSSNPNHDTSSGDHELMIWLGRLGGVSPIGSSTGTVNVNGQDWDLWVGPNGDMQVYSFVAPETRSNFDGNIKDFFDVVSKKQPGFKADEQYLLTAQFGTEPFSGTNAKFNVWWWNASVE